METWRKIWRDGFSDQFTIAGLEALRRALIEDDERLLQGATCTPPPLQCLLECPVQATCAVSFPAWQGDGLGTVGEIEERFVDMCAEVDCRLGEPAASRWFLNWYDDTPREEMLAEMLTEVQRTLARRRTETVIRAVSVEAA